MTTRKFVPLYRPCVLLVISMLIAACNIPAGTPAPTGTPNTIQTAFAIATITGAAYTPAFVPPGVVQPFPTSQTPTPQIPVTGGTAAPTTPPAPGQSTWPTHQLGSQGPEVFAIQGLLREYGYQITADGIFGSATENAVVNFQTTRGLEPTGIVDDRMFPILIQGATVQRGDEGEAVRDFQSVRGLLVDGIVGPQTWQALFRP